ARQKKDLDVVAAGRQTPDQSRRQESVVQPLIRRQSLRRLRQLRRQPKGAAPERLGPEEHLQHQKGEMQQRDNGDEDVRRDSHRAAASMVRRTRVSPRTMSSGDTAPALRRNQPLSCFSPKAWNGTTAKPASSSSS